MFFNTTSETGENLRTYLIKAHTQDDDVLQYFRANPDDDQVTPEKVIVYLSQINPRKYDHPTIIISIRRSFNTLKNHNIIEMTGGKTKGMRGRMVNCWRLCK